MGYILEGMALGFAYVAPIGMQNLFLINTALTQKRTRLISVALITFFFDFFMALACFYGMGTLMQTHKVIEASVLGIGSLLIILISFGLLRAKPEVAAAINVNIPFSRVVMTAFTVTWLNPQAVLDGTMLLGAFQITLSPEASKLMFMGIILATFLWFMSLSLIINLFKQKINASILRFINVACGAIIGIYGLHLLWTFINFDFSNILS